MTASPEAFPASQDGAPSRVQPVEAVRRALRILQCFDVDRRELGVTEVAEELGLHKATAHRLLATLEAEGFVRRTDQKRYQLGLRAYRIGLLAMPGAEQREAVKEELRQLAAVTGETAHLATLDGNQVLYLEKVEGSHRLRLPSAVARRVPPHCTGLGKVLLAALPADQRLRVLATLRWERYTPNTITDPTAFTYELEHVGEEGIAFDNQEFEEGLTCLAAPVLSESGTVMAAVSISGPSPRFDTYRDQYVEHIRAAAASLSTRAAEYLQSLEPPAGPALSANGGGSW